MAIKFPISLAGKRDSEYSPPVDTFVFDINDGVVDSRTGDIPSAWKFNKDNLYSLEIGSSCTSIGSRAFRYCDNLGKNGELGLYLPDSVTVVNSYAFQRNFGFDNKPLRLSNNLTSVGTQAFLSCNFGGDLVIPDSLVSLPNICFENHKFTSISFGSGLTTIPSSCFKNNRQLTSLNIPNTVTSIGYAAFQDLKNATGDLIIPDSVLGSVSGFSGGGFTGDIYIGNSVTAIGGNCFSNTKFAAGTLTIGNSVQTIGSYAFRYCFELTGDLFIPDSVTSIGSWVWGRTKLGDVYINKPASVFTSSQAFKQYPNNRTLYVTSAYLSQYDSTWKSAQLWTQERTVQEWTSYPDPMP